MRPRAKGVIGVVDTKPSGSLWEQAKAILKAKADAAAERKAKRDATPVPNWKCYSTVFKVGVNVDHNGNWLGGILPKCRVCEGPLPPREHHTCPGFKPKYVEHDEAWKEKQEARREAIRESRRGRGVYCSECNELMADPEDAQWHWEDHEGKPEREHYGLKGDEDDLSGYEDEPEEDYVEGDDDGYDCD